MRRCFKFGILIVLILTLSCSVEVKTNINKQAMYLELNLNDSINTNPFARVTSPLEVFRIIERAANDDRINGIILNIGYINRSREYLWELRTALEKFKFGGTDGIDRRADGTENEPKKIIAYISNADIDTYMLASVADKIAMDELGILTMLGYSAGRGYVSQTLEKFGIGVQELRYFEYKSAAESYTRTNMSAADRRQYNDYLDDVYNQTRSILMEARGWTPEEFNNIINRNFLHSAANALEHNLIDYIGKAEIKNAISEIEENNLVIYTLYGNTTTSITGAKIKYSVPKEKSSQTIAVVYANGETDMTRGMEIAKLAKTINELADNFTVKAIVVRVNSPGGSAQAAEALAEAISYARSKKPVVISMGQVAASGGYWVSVPANHIMATPYTITGSIGVIGSWFYNNGLYNKMGVSVDVLKRGDHSDLMTGFLIPYRRLTAQEEEQYKNYILDLYYVFLFKVASNRDMYLEDVEAVAQGRIFSGFRALEEGLVDSVGGLYDAVNMARTLAKIEQGTTVNIREYPEPKLMDILMGRFMTASNAKSASSILDSFIPGAMLQDIRYRLENNGQVMPILPLEFSVY